MERDIDTAHAGIRILGSLRSADGKGVVRMEDRVNASIGDGERCDSKARWDELFPAYRDMAASMGV